MEKTNAGYSVIDLPALIEFFDKRGIAGPNDLANEVWINFKEQFPELENWNLLCFAFEFLALSCETYKWLPKEHLKEIGRLIYVAHYTAIAPRRLAEKEASIITDGQNSETNDGGGHAEMASEREDSDGNGATDKPENSNDEGSS